MYPATLGLILVVLDQWTKWVIRLKLDLFEQIPVIPGFFNITYVRNTGAAFGIFQGRNVELGILSLVMLSLLVFFRKHLFGQDKLSQTAYGCLIGGILGNFFDRVKLFYVVDFLDFHIGDKHFPAFNIADSAICIGVALYMVSSFLEQMRVNKTGSAQTGDHTTPA